MKQSLLEKLRKYFSDDMSVVLAFLFGSHACGAEGDKSDLDIAVYLNDLSQESRIWQELAPICEKELDLVVLNEAPATLISSVIKTGLPLVIKDRLLYLRLYLDKTLEAEDFAHFVVDYMRIYQRSQSLNPEDRTRILERIQFVQSELADIERFRLLSMDEYEENRPKRREVERWAENIMNATIDIAKIILASERKDIPKTYEESLRELAIFAGFDSKKAMRFSYFARFRNLLAHEYFDLLYKQLRQFIDEFPVLYKDISLFLKRYLT